MTEQYSDAWRNEVLSRRKDFIVTLLENVCKERDNKDAHIAALEARLAEAEQVIKAGQVLVLRMFEVYDDLQYQTAFHLLADHQGRYSGKTWTKEQDDFTDRAAAFLAGGEPKEI